MLNDKKLVLHKRTLAKTLYAQLHELENTLNRFDSMEMLRRYDRLVCFSNYLKYPCNDESVALANANRVVYELATGRRLNPTRPKRYRFLGVSVD